ncbi:protein phosphatase type 1 regulator-like protein [Angomonas deanei]|nr:protein phosphatase type 1 regulator-like protein [Angomonas deanei]EPY43124.1 protein phosphatase type 1 regulator-like protein [Angomonas deanei]|eukprot:EPY30664.1 protein phosphatase type 1 regulator-like protein [Angomonas deanei]
MFGKKTPEEKAALQARLAKAFEGEGEQEKVNLHRQPESDEDLDEDHADVPERHDPSYRHAVETLRVNATSEVVEVSNVRLFTIEDLDLNSLTNCVSLSLRKNLIHELSPFPLHLANRLEEVDFFDNKIRKVRDFFVSATVPDEENPSEDGPKLIKKSFEHPFSHITKLDLSYNQIKHVNGLDSLAGTLKQLYLVENKIKSVEGLDALVNLELLELGGNRIREIGDGLKHLVNLKQLWIGKNKIASIGTSLHTLSKLELVSLQANRLLSIEPENFPEGKHPVLKEIYFSENGLSEIVNLPLHATTIIDFSFNPIKSINKDVINPTNMPKLEEFWLTDGGLDDWEEVNKLIPFSSTLHTVYLERNPIEHDRRYRDKVYRTLPFLTQIDSWPIVNKDNVEADRSIQRHGDAKKAVESKLLAKLAKKKEEEEKNNAQ